MVEVYKKNTWVGVWRGRNCAGAGTGADADASVGTDVGVVVGPTGGGAAALTARDPSGVSLWLKHEERRRWQRALKRHMSCKVAGWREG